MKNQSIFRLLTLSVCIIALLATIGYTYTHEERKNRAEEIDSIVSNLDSMGSKLIELSDGSYLIIWDE